MLLIEINKKHKHPAYKQIVAQIIEKIQSGFLKEGETLPSSRKLAEILGINRTTVYRAYQELWAAGYISSEIGGYSRVRIPKNLHHQEYEEQLSSFDWEDHFSSLAINLPYSSIAHYEKNNSVIDFRTLSPDSNLLPYDNFRKCINTILKKDSKSILDYGDPQGYLPLRKGIAKNMNLHGIRASEDEIIITNGIQNGLELLMRVLLNPGDTIFVENPTYARALEMFRLLGINIVGINMNTEGIDLKHLKKMLKSHKPKLIYTIPTFHNPTGITSSQIYREDLLSLCIEHDTPLIEDGFEEDMKYFGKAILPIKSMDKNNLVIYQGTFSKVLFPGVRVGWIVADKRIVNKLKEVKRISELSSVTLTHAAIHQFCTEGKYELHKQRMHRAFKKRMLTAIQACRKYLPEDKIHYTKPDGGYLIWFTLLDENINERSFAEEVHKKGVLISPGSACFCKPPSKAHFRVSISNSNEIQIEEGIKKIAEVVNTL